MQIKMLKTTNCDGKTVVAGEVVKDPSVKDARFLINTGMAVEYTAPAKPKTPKKTDKSVSTEDLVTR